MSPEKRITVAASGEAMTITTSRSLGLFMLHPEVGDIVSRFGAKLQKDPDSDTWAIVPPIGKEHVDIFGQALIEMAQTIDPDGPAPKFEFKKI